MSNERGQYGRSHSVQYGDPYIGQALTMPRNLTPWMHLEAATRAFDRVHTKRKVR